MPPGRGFERFKDGTHDRPDQGSSAASRRAASPLLSVLALQRNAGNRATVATLQRAVVASEKLPMVRFTVGVEVSAALAAAGWLMTIKGALDDAAISDLRQIALAGDQTIDDNERLFIAALLDPLNAARLHQMLPNGFTPDADEIEFPVQRMSAAQRDRVRDFGRSTPSGTDANSPRPSARGLDAAIIQMAGAFSASARKTLTIADSFHIPHADVLAAMVAAASDSTAGDRALAAAVFVIARSQQLPEADDILAGRIKVDEVPASYIGSQVAAEYFTAGSRLKGDTLYIRSTFDVADIDDQGTVIHELSHAADDKAASHVTSGQADQMELRAFRAQARFYLNTIDGLGGDARAAAIARIAAHAGAVRVYTMLLEANVAPIEQWDELLAIIAEVNATSGALDAHDWHVAVGASTGDLERLALKAIRRLERLAPGQTGINDGLSGESVLDRKPQDGASLHRLSRRPETPAPQRGLARTPASSPVAGPAASPSPAPYRLRYMDDHGSDVDQDGDVRQRPLALDEREFQDNYVDLNITKVTAQVTIDAGTYRELVVHYKDGRELTIPRSRIPTYANNRPGANVIHVSGFTDFERHQDDDLIYPTLRGNIVFDDKLTPNLVSARETADEIASKLRDLRQLLDTAGAFASIIAMYSSVIGYAHQVSNGESIFEMASPGQREPALPQVVDETPIERTVKRTGGGPAVDEPPKTPMRLDEPGAPTPKPAPTDPPAGKSRRTDPLGGRRPPPSEEELVGSSAKRPRKKSARPFNHRDPDDGELSGTGSQKQPAANAGGSLRQLAQNAGVADEIEGAFEVLAYGTTQNAATGVINNSGFGESGGNFGGRMFMASNLETARVFAARRVTQVPKSTAGIVGIALPKDVFDSLRQQKLLVFSRMTDPPPELVGSPTQWEVSPAAVRQISDHGYFFKIE